MDTKQIVLVYASESLYNQINSWIRRCPGSGLSLSQFSLLPDQNPAVVLVDATADSERARNALHEAVRRFGRSRVSLYSERADEYLEKTARELGCLVLFGPMSESLWSSYFDGMLRSRLFCLASRRNSSKASRMFSPPYASGTLADSMLSLRETAESVTSETRTVSS